MEKMKEQAFIEYQYLGRNKYALNRRLVLAAFCFVVFFFSGNDATSMEIDLPREFILYLGIFILVWSVVLMRILFLKIVVDDDNLTLDGLWTSRKVKVPLSQFVEVEKVPYSRYILNRPVYNLHRKGTIRFYSSGKSAIRLTDKDGLSYLIGTQDQEKFYSALRERIKS